MYDRQRWLQEVTLVAKQAIRILNNIQQLPVNPVIIFDVDHTLIDEYECIIQPIFVLHQFANMLGINSIIVTSRPGNEDMIKHTLKLLDDYKIHRISAYFRKEENQNNWKFKQSARQNLIDRGYNIVMSVGDQDWDIIGPNTGIGIKVPHIIWFSSLYPVYEQPNEGYQSFSTKKESSLSSNHTYSESPLQTHPLQTHPLQTHPLQTRSQSNPPDQDLHHQ